MRQSTEMVDAGRGGHPCEPIETPSGREYMTPAFGSASSIVDPPRPRPIPWKADSPLKHIDWVPASSVAGETGAEDAATTPVADGDACAGLPNGAEGTLLAAHSLRDAGAFAAAELRYRDAIAADPACAEAHAALGLLLADIGRPGEAIDAIRRAVELEPSRVDRRRVLADLLAGSGHGDDAMGIYEALVDLRPDSASLRRALAALLAAHGRVDEAIEQYREAVFLDCRDLDTVAALARLLCGRGEPKAALELLQPALRVDDGHAGALLECARAWLDLGERDRALPLLKRVADDDPQYGAQAQALMRSVEDPDSNRLSPSYVRTLFDQYADSFDEDLVVRLRYMGPQALRGAVDRILGPGAVNLDVLDLGCGTGLAGVEFKPIARHLVGVDLSPRMVEKAALRGVYDRLAVDDLSAALMSSAAWDLVIAADVMVYVGDLAPVMAGVADALRAGGLFAATVERADGDGFMLGPNRRYAHGEAHIRESAARAGLSVLLVEPVIPRWERGMPVAGLLFVVRRDASLTGGASPAGRDVRGGLAEGPRYG